MKIGITTHYYKSVNYGGNLQAYALCRVIKEMGHEPEQLCIVTDPPTRSANGSAKKRSLLRRIVSLPIRAVRSLRPRLVRYRFSLVDKKYDLMKRRLAAFSHFSNEMIPHSERLYSPSNASESAKIYDAFITGSDQVWSLRWLSNTFLLRFVPEGTPKISYAASLARESLTQEQKDIFKEALRDYRAISVRESISIELLKETEMPITQVVDPVLLLSREEWENVSRPYPIDGKYVFCYFLGNNPKNYRMARKFAKRKGLTLVNIPYAGGRLKVNDGKFGDVRVFDASPEQFISLVKNAEYVLTDSFHAVVFSNIFEKQYFVFDRDPNGEMRSRITDITELFGQSDRFCTGKDKARLAYVESLCDIDYTRERATFENMKKHSEKFLKKALEI